MVNVKATLTGAAIVTFVCYVGHWAFHLFLGA